MYRITPVKSPVWLPLLPLALAFLALVAISYSVWFAAHSTPATRQSVHGTVVVVTLYFGVFSLLGAVIVAAVLKDEYRNGREVIFDDCLTIHYPWPFGARRYAWNEIARIEPIDESYVVREPMIWVPLPVGAIIPGADAILSIRTYEERTMTVRKFRIVHVDGRKLTEITGSTKLNFTIVRWLSRKTLNDLVVALGGSIEWRGDIPRSLSFRRSRITENEWTKIKQEIANIVGVEEIDISETRLGDPGLLGLEKLPSLRTVKTDGTKISSAKKQQLIVALNQRATSKQFDFLAR